jgi:hypothetical protein
VLGPVEFGEKKEKNLNGERRDPNFFPDTQNNPSVTGYEIRSDRNVMKNLIKRIF